MKNRILFIFSIVCAPIMLFGQTDSLRIQGTIKNLSGGLYRQNSAVSFFRSNIFDPQSEMVKSAPLQADGSFAVSLPLHFSQEEVYLEYGSLASTPFLAGKGEMNITFDADSIGLAKRLFYFSGILAGANNQYQLYMPIEAKAFEGNTSLGADFFKNFWPKSQGQAKSLLDQRLQFRLLLLENYSRKSLVDPDLKKWLSTKAQAEHANIWMDYLRVNDLDIEGEKLEQAEINRPPLTAEKVTLAEKYGIYADIKKDFLVYQYPSKSAPLPVKTMAGLIRKYNSDLTGQERSQLDQIVQTGISDRSEYDFLNRLFLRNKEQLNTLFDYEQASRLYAELLPASMMDLLYGSYLSKRFSGLSIDQKLLLERHIQGDMKSQAMKNALAEVVRREVKDSVNIRKMVNYQAQQLKPTEIVPDIWISTSQNAGNAWFKDILDQYKGKTIYVVKWNLADGKSQSDLAQINFLRDNAPTGTVFLFVHMDDFEQEVSQIELARQYVIRHNLKGTHMFVQSGQMLSLLLKLSPLDAGTYAIIKPNGKYYAKNAPAPTDPDRLIPMLNEASK